jgi:hypothetical protein
MVNQSPRLVVRNHKPLQRALLVLVGVALLLGSNWLLYQYGRQQAGLDFVALQQQRSELRARIEQLENRNQQLADERIALQRTGQIDRQAYQQVDQSLRALQAEISELKEEVAFYRSIVAPRESSRGLRIQRFTIEANAEPRSYSYRLVLTQVIKNNRVAKGHIDISVEGLQDGKHRKLAIGDIQTDKDKSLNFRFKYFQNFEGDVILPEGFTPSRVYVEVKSRKAGIKRTFDWPA